MTFSPNFFFSSTTAHYEANYRPTFSYLDSLEYPRNYQPDDQQWNILFPHIDFRRSFLFFSRSSSRILHSLSLSLFLVAPSTIETTVSKEKEINRDNIYLSPQKKERKKERNEKHRPSILTSFFLIVIFPCGI